MKEGKLAVLGVLQEQHPERTNLFMQWQGLDFPLLADPLNLLDVAAVPITLLVDRHGVIRYRNPGDGDFAEFMKKDYAAGKVQKPVLPGSEWVLADRQAMSNQPGVAMRSYQKMLEKSPQSGRLHFRLGVVYRMAFDAGRKPEDFAKAVEHWQKARAINGGQYIWRRRIQQYGPQPDKPYPFYDWVDRAQKEIAARGEKPVKLRVALSVSEKMGRGSMPDVSKPMEKPVTTGIIEDSGSVTIRPVVLPSTSGKKNVFRVHLLLRPVQGGKHVWNNEAGPVKIWLDVPEGAGVKPRAMELAVDATRATSEETRSVEFEWRKGAEKKLSGYAVYHVCDKASGRCSVLMQRFAVEP